MQAPPADFLVSIVSDNGSVPPSDRRSTRLTIRASGSWERTQLTGYADDTAEMKVSQLDPRSLDSLFADLVSLGLLDNDWVETNPRKIGGGGKTVQARANGIDVRIPRHVSSEQREAKEAIVARIRACLPA